MNKTIYTLLLLGSALSAQANITFLNVDCGQSVNITYNSNARGVFAGKLKFHNNVSNQDMLTVCCDLDNTISGGQTYNCNAFNSSGVGGGITLAGNIVGGGFISASSNEDCAALQLAVWEATYDGVGNGGVADFTNGIFGADISGSLLTAATGYYALTGVPGSATYYKPDPLNAGQGQLGPVPEPATYAAVGLGLALLIRRKRK